MSDNYNPSQEERNIAMLCHLGAFAGYIVPVLGSLLVPLIIWLQKKDESEFVNFHGKESLNFQITMLLAFTVSFILVFVIIGIPLLIGLGIFELVMLIIAAVKSNDGDYFRYPFCIRFIG